jgi:hypothetical protein
MITVDGIESVPCSTQHVKPMFTVLEDEPNGFTEYRPWDSNDYTEPFQLGPVSEWWPSMMAGYNITEQDVEAMRGLPAPA